MNDRNHKRALIVANAQIDENTERLEAILRVANMADIVILSHEWKERVPASLKRVADFTITTGKKGTEKEAFSAFEGGTLRPIKSLEEILSQEHVGDVIVCGWTLNSMVGQTAFDARALGYDTTVCYDGSRAGGEILQISIRLDNAGIWIKDSTEIWKD